jgi:hypothetical protein
MEAVYLWDVSEGLPDYILQDSAHKFHSPVTL